MTIVLQLKHKPAVAGGGLRKNGKAGLCSDHWRGEGAERK